MAEARRVLTKRQSEVVELAMKGLADCEAAVRLGISVETVRGYWREIRSRYAGANRAFIINLLRTQYSTRLIQGEVIEIKTGAATSDLPDLWLAVLNALDTPVRIVWGDEGQVVLVNNALRDLLHGQAPYSKSKDEYDDWKGFLPDGTPIPPDAWPVIRAMQTGAEAHEDVYFMRPDRTWIFVGIRALPIVDGTRVLGSIAIWTLLREGEEPPIL